MTVGFDRSLKLAFGLVCVAGCMQESAWRGVMRSLDNFSKAASNNRWCEGAWPPQLATARGGGRKRVGWLVGSVKDPVRISCIVKFETPRHESCEISRKKTKKQLRTTYFLSGSCSSAPFRHTRCILINPPKLSRGGRKAKCTWQSGRGRRGAVGVIKEWFGRRPSQSAAERRFTQAGGAYNWLFVAVRGNEHVRPSLPAFFLDNTPRKLWRQTHVSLSLFFFFFSFPFFFYLPGKKKTIKHGSSLGSFCSAVPSVMLLQRHMTALKSASQEHCYLISIIAVILSRRQNYTTCSTRHVRGALWVAQRAFGTRLSWLNCFIPAFDRHRVNKSGAFSLKHCIKLLFQLQKLRLSFYKSMFLAGWCLF